MTDNGQPVGQRYIDFVPGFLAEKINSSGSDGLGTDGIYRKVHYEYSNYRNLWPDVDIDHNGQNDRNESGKGNSWVVDHHVAGVDQMISNIRSRIGPDKIIILNTGSSEFFGKPHVNGYLFENSGPNYSPWEGQFGMLAQWANINKDLREPKISLNEYNVDGLDPGRVSPSKNYYQYIRFSLGKSMLFGTYFDYGTLESRGDNYYNKYYDEFDLDLGKPLGDMQKIKTDAWARFFERGAVIVNLKGGSMTVTDSEIRNLSGYSGPYHRFRGGQDSAMNNGEQFSSVSLAGHSFNSNGLHAIVGDAVLLVTEPMTVISDIVIDESNSGTNPGSNKAVLSGNWEFTCDGRDYYTLRCAPWVDEAWSVALNSSGSGTADFVPTITQPGRYEVYEWHGVPLQTAANNVSYTIRHAGGTTKKTVDQSKSYGKWNSLGTYRFEKGTAGKVTLSAQGANGLVMADAVKFVYKN
ncbi:hypothetical protein IID21_03805 [Patescibacteria group bacterium]|nr:hypothetical protein [Patescibacteria group bacterium]